MPETVIVRVTQGDLRGRKVVTKSGLQYCSFQGIPYAKPPVGNLRFQAPQCAEPWQGVRDALVEGAVCPQMDVHHGYVYVGDEDCLFLNVYTCQLPPGVNADKAVMVWFHGGCFIFGSGNTDMHDPGYLMEGDVVLVTVNYRMGPFGFLSLPDEEIPGNNGLKDQVMALRWVQQNIKHFGGDPDNVTIFGVSAGAASVQYHLMSPMSAGLFHRAIMQNGSALNPWAYDDPTSARRKAFQLGEFLGLTTTDSKELLAFLQNLSSKDIVTGLHNALTDEDTLLLTPYSLPTKETSNNGTAFLPDSPHNLLKTGKFCDVPLIAGNSSHEGMIMIPRILNKPHLLPWVDSNFQLVLSRTLCLRENADFAREITQKVKHFYFGNKPLSKETLSNYIEFNTDALFVRGISCTVKQHVAFHTSPVFYYQFAFDGKLGLLKNLLGMKNQSGVCHGDEVGYLFDGSLQDAILDPQSSEMQTIQRLVRLWTNFAKTGNPTPGHDPMLEVIWSPATKSELSYLNIDEELKMRRDLRIENVHFWEQIYTATFQEGD